MDWPSSRPWPRDAAARLDRRSPGMSCGLGCFLLRPGVRPRPLFGLFLFGFFSHPLPSPCYVQGLVLALCAGITPGAQDHSWQSRGALCGIRCRSKPNALTHCCTFAPTPPLQHLHSVGLCMAPEQHRKAPVKTTRTNRDKGNILYL